MLAILEDEQVQSWKNDYSNIFDDLTLDGLSWNLTIGFTDGAIEKHHGYGVLERNAPKNFSDLEEKLIAFAIDVLQKNSQK